MMKEIELLSPSFIKQLCQSLNIHPTKQLGQNFVVDASTVRKIVTAAKLDEGSRVLEVGPGLGSLTLGLLEAGALVTAVEIDPKLAVLLPQTLAQKAPGYESKYRVLQGDALKVTPSIIAEKIQEFPSKESFAEPEILVSNLPYNVAVPVIIHILKVFPSVKKILVMVQKEVALRLAAEVGNRLYGIPSVKAAWWGKARLAGNISRNVFYPIPNVDSALIEISDNPGFEDRYREDCFALIDMAFAARRKMLRSTLKNWVSSAAELAEIFDRCALDLSARAETLKVDDFYKLVLAKEQLATESKQK